MILQRINNVVVWALLRLALIDCTLEEVKNKIYRPSGKPDDESEGNDFKSDDVLEVARGYSEDKVKRMEERRTRVDDKLERLLILNGIATTVLSGLTMSATVLYMIPILLLVSSTVLVAFGLSVHRFQEVYLTRDEASKSEAEIKRALLKASLVSTKANSLTVDFMVDCFRAALRLLVAAILVTLLVLGAARLLSQQSDPNELVTRLRANPDLIRVLRGPEGQPGPRGPAGLAGHDGRDGLNGRCDCRDAGGGHP